MYPFISIMNVLKANNVHAIRIDTRIIPVSVLDDMKVHLNNVFTDFTIDSNNTVYGHINQNKIKLFDFQKQLCTSSDALQFNNCNCGGSIQVTIANVQNLTGVTILCHKCLKKLYYPTYEDALFIWNTENPNVSRETKED